MDYHEFFFESHVDYTNSLVRELHETKSFFDVTLVCADDIKIKAHKFILSSYSEVFELTLKMVNDVINVPKIKKEEMVLILQFMYLGKVDVPKKNVIDFAHGIRELKVRNMDNESTVKLLKEHVEDVKLEKSDIMDEISTETEPMHDKNSSSLVKEKKSTKKKNRLNLKWKCIECGLTLRRQSSLNFHMDSVHGTKWKCCDKIFKSQSALNYHKEAFHDQLKHPCSHCPLSMSSRSNLRQHIKSKHMNIGFPCMQCSYKGTQAASLRRHMKSMHTIGKREKFPCMQCSYKGTQASALRRHINSIHNIGKCEKLIEKYW